MTARPLSYTVVIADTDLDRIDGLRIALESLGLSVLAAGSETELIQLLHDGVAVLIVHATFAEPQTRRVTEGIRARAPDTQIVLYGDSPSTKRSLQGLSEGDLWQLAESGDAETLLLVVTKACVQWELRRDNRLLRSTMSLPMAPVSLCGRSSAIRVVLSRAEKASASEATLLIVGESGTGKSTLARFVHQLGPRRDKPFVAISCAAVPRDLLEAELFGHERGAFTGAVASRAGSIELANGGTLFLDEIGDMPLDLQPKLLTFLQDRTVKRIGGVRTASVDVRIIAATNRRLEELCQQKLFREDLYFRLNVLSISMPPLRDREGDVSELIDFTLQRIADRRGGKPFTVSTAARNELMRYSWPGNIRELENILERAAAFSEHPILDVSDLDLHNELGGAKGRSTPTAATSLAGRSLADIEACAIRETLALCRYNKAEAAARLGISLKGLYNKLKKLDATDDEQR